MSGDYLDTSGGGNGWEQYQRLVLNELKRHNSLIESLRTDISNLRNDISILKVKSGVWGLLGGLVPAAMIIILYLLKTNLVSQ